VFGPTISVVHQFHRPPYGGGNQFLLALFNEWRQNGYDVGARRIGSSTRYVLFNSFNFNMDRLRDRLKDRAKSGIRAVHRVDGPISAYRGQDIQVDRAICAINRELADATVFQSAFSQGKHVELGLDLRNPHVIMNAVNPQIFHSENRTAALGDGARKVRLIASSWSPNRRKGADVYEWLDKNLDFGSFDMTFVGNTPSKFSNIRTISAVPSPQLAELLRQSDIYITASINDPCSNALIESLACGLPALYRNSGGHPEIVGSAGFGFDEAEEIPSLLDRVIDGYLGLQRAISIPSIEEVARQYLALLGVDSPSAQVNCQNNRGRNERV
jgi:glycosyltransferase involved in cell wall biosynthesis